MPTTLDKVLDVHYDGMVSAADKYMSTMVFDKMHDVLRNKGDNVYMSMTLFSKI
jgi:hypothetical protein